MNERDPFAPDADPYPSLSRRGLSRRAFGGAVVALPIVAALAGCARVPPACPTQPESPRACKHRFCRYYGGLR